MHWARIDDPRIHTMRDACLPSEPATRRSLTKPEFNSNRPLALKMASHCSSHLSRRSECLTQNRFSGSISFCFAITSLGTDPSHSIVDKLAIKQFFERWTLCSSRYPRDHLRASPTTRDGSDHRSANQSHWWISQYPARKSVATID